MKAESLPSEIHFDCPNCERHMKGERALLGEMVQCPDCETNFVPSPRKDKKTTSKPPLNWKRNLYGAVILLAVFGAGYFIHQYLRATQFNDPNNLGNYLGPHDEQSISALAKISEQLISPKTAQFVHGKFWNVDGPQKTLARITIDSQNVYGALIRTEWGIQMHLFRYETNNWWSVDDCLLLQGSRTVLK